MTHDEAMDGHTISFARAQAEMKRHGMDCIMCPAEEGYIIAGNPMDPDDQGHRIPCDTRSILEWLGY